MSDATRLTLMPGGQLQLVAGDARSGHRADDLRLDAEVAQRLDEAPRTRRRWSAASRRPLRPRARGGAGREPSRRDARGSAKASAVASSSDVLGDRRRRGSSARRRRPPGPPQTVRVCRSPTPATPRARRRRSRARRGRRRRGGGPAAPARDAASTDRAGAPNTVAARDGSSTAVSSSPASITRVAVPRRRSLRLSAWALAARPAWLTPARDRRAQRPSEEPVTSRSPPRSSATTRTSTPRPPTNGCSSAQRASPTAPP